MTWQTSAYVVSDFGGEWEDAWEYPVCAFTSKGMAESCALKRERRHKARCCDDDWCDDYIASRVQCVPLVVEEGSVSLVKAAGAGALKRLLRLSQRAGRGEPIVINGHVYVPESATHTSRQ